MKKYYFHKHFLFLLFSHCVFTSIAQGNKMFIEPSFYYGRIVKHTTPFPEINHNTLTIALNFTQQPSGKKLWHRLYRIADFGIGVVYSNFGDKDILGHAFGILPHLTFSSLKNKKIKFYYAIGTGLAFISNPYDILENETNNVIGSHINNLSYLNFGAEWKLSGKFSIKPSVSLIHFSNGRSKLPNLGYNIPSVSLMGKFFLAENKRQVSTDTTPPANKKFHWGAAIGYGINQLKNSRGPIYSLYLGKIFISKNLSLKNKLSSGIEYVFDTGEYSFIQLHELYPENQKLYASRIIAFLAHDFLMGHLGFYGQVGFFLNKPFDSGTKIPTKLGIQYYFYTPYFRNHHHFYTGIYLAAHSFEADYIHWGFGYIF